MKLDPILKREIRVQSRGYGLMMMVSILNLILFLIGILGMLAVISRLRQSLEADYGALLGVYAVLVIISFLILTLACPAMTAGSISGERQAKTLELLLITRLEPAGIVIGKLSSKLCITGVLILSSLPAIMLPLIYGGIGAFDIFMTVLTFFVSALLYLSIGIFAGSGTRSVQRSTVMAYALLLMLLLGTALPGMIMSGFCTAYDNNAAALLLMLDPLVTMLIMISGQTGGGGMGQLLYEGLNCRYYEGMSSAYVPVCLLLEAALAVCFIFLSVKSIKRMQGH